MSPLSLILVAAAAVAAAPFAGAAQPNSEASDLLEKYGLPKGLVPDAVASYTFDEASGDFEIHLAGTCYARFGSHLVYYEKSISGCLTSGKITDLSGIQAKKLFLWVSVSGIVAHPDHGTLEFQAGFISEELSVKLFDKVPSCGASAGAELRGMAGVIRELDLLPVAAVAPVLANSFGIEVGTDAKTICKKWSNLKNKFSVMAKNGGLHNRKFHQRRNRRVIELSALASGKRGRTSTYAEHGDNVDFN